MSIFKTVWRPVIKQKASSRKFSSISLSLCCVHGEVKLVVSVWQKRKLNPKQCTPSPRRPEFGLRELYATFSRYDFSSRPFWPEVLFVVHLCFGVVLQQLHHVMKPVAQLRGAAMLAECVQSIWGGDPLTVNIGQQVRVCQLGQDNLGVISIEVHL